MFYNVYSVRDEKTSFASPYIDATDASAERGFRMAFNMPNSVVQFSPSDFSLYRIGTFNSESGELVPCLPEFICNASKFFNMVGEVNEE